MAIDHSNCVDYIDSNGLKARWVLATEDDQCCLYNVDEKRYCYLNANLKKEDLVALKQLVDQTLAKMEN